MFKTKKQLRGELDFAVGKCSGLERSIEVVREVLSRRTDEQEEMMQRLCKYVADNVKLKHDLDIEIRQKEEISEMLALLTKKPDSGDDCPADCVRYEFRGVHGVCKSCWRSPVMTDNYEAKE